jgi:hypothetical protein
MPLGSGDISTIGAYFAGHGAPVATVATHSVNVSVGGTVPNSVALFPCCECDHSYVATFAVTGP